MRGGDRIPLSYVCVPCEWIGVPCECRVCRLFEIPLEFPNSHTLRPCDTRTDHNQQHHIVIKTTVDPSRTHIHTIYRCDLMSSSISSRGSSWLGLPDSLVRSVFSFHIKYENIQITMRDGARLAGDLYLPAVEGEPEEGQYSVFESSGAHRVSGCRRRRGSTLPLSHRSTH